MALAAAARPELEVSRVGLVSILEKYSCIRSLAGHRKHVLELFVIQPVLVRMLHRWPDRYRLSSPDGQRQGIRFSFSPHMGFGAFGEKLVYRGYLNESPSRPLRTNANRLGI